jgi:hypothetical protein
MVLTGYYLPYLAMRSGSSFDIARHLMPDPPLPVSFCPLEQPYPSALSSLSRPPAALPIKQRLADNTSTLRYPQGLGIGRVYHSGYR